MKEISNAMTVTVKMTRGQALKLCRLIVNYSESLRKDELRTCDVAADEWMKIHDKVRAGVDALDERYRKEDL